LYIGGAGLARGYLNDEDLTRDRFIPNRFATAADKGRGYDRLYKTGDLVRWLEDGNLEYIGRNDDQVKIRGFRVELGEVEHALSEVEGIRQSCVLLGDRETDSGLVKYLRCYYVLEAGVSKSDDLILADLSSRLPDYMIPSVFQELASFPLTINGKLDKGALPALDLEKGEDYVAPKTEAAVVLCKIWQEVLGLERVGIRDNFFRVGGDSILSIQLSSRLRREGYDCHVRDIFSYNTIDRLLGYLEGKDSDRTIKSEQGILTGEFGLLPIQRWFTSRIDRGELDYFNHWNQSFLIKVPELEEERLRSIIIDLLNYHDLLRVRFIKGDVWVQEYQSEEVYPELKRCNVSGYTDEALQEELTIWQGGFDIEGGPLFQFGYLYGYEDGSARLYVSAHHLVIDSVSWRILTADLRRLYEGKLLPVKGSSYRQWVDLIECYPGHYPEERIYWQDVLEGLPFYDPQGSHSVSLAGFGLSKKLTTNSTVAKVIGSVPDRG